MLVLEPDRRREALQRIVAQEHIYKKHLTRLLAQKRRAPAEMDAPVLVDRLGLEAALLHTEAHLKWLECCRLQLEVSGGSSLEIRPEDQGQRSLPVA